MFEQHRSFAVMSRNDCDRGVVAEVMFGLYPDDASTDGIDTSEMAMRWIEVGSIGVCARLDAFDDSWRALATMPDVVAWLGSLPHPDWSRGRRPQHAVLDVAAFCEGLKALGFEDRTRASVRAEG